MKWNFHPEALAEYESAAAYYSERDPELQLRFIEAIENSIDRILEAPIRWRVIDDLTPDNEMREYAAREVS